MRLNPSIDPERETNTKEKSKVVSNKSIDETDKNTKPVVTSDTEEQRYSSRVVNTEPMFVKDLDNMKYSDYKGDESSFSDSTPLNLDNWEVGTDSDDPSSGMS